MTRRLLLIAGGLSGALLLIVVGWSSVGHHSGQVPVVQADSRPVRVKPANPGGMQIPGLSADAGAGDASAANGLAPAPETPDPQALARQPPRPAPSVATSQGAATAAPAAPVHAGIAAAAPVTPVGRAPVSAAPMNAASASGTPAATRPAQMAAATGAEHRAPPPARHAQVQLAAVDTETAARQEWDRLAHRMPGVFAAHRPLISKVEHDGHTLWRVRTGDFATEAEAGQFCHEVKAKGAGCAVAAF